MRTKLLRRISRWIHSSRTLHIHQESLRIRRQRHLRWELLEGRRMLSADFGFWIGPGHDGPGSQGIAVAGEYQRLTDPIPGYTKSADWISIGGLHGPIVQSESLSLVVDTLTDIVDGDYSAGNFSLREAILVATANPGADAITFDPSLAGEEIALTQGQFEITDQVTIIGLGADPLTIRQTVGESRLFDVTNSGNLTIEGLTLTGGSTVTGGGFMEGSGGAIRNLGGAVSIIQSTILGNTAEYDGGGIFNIDAGSLIVSGSTISENSSTHGGGIFNRNSGTVTVIGSTISENLADYGGGIYSSDDGSSVTIVDSLLSGNSVPWGGGGINNQFSSTVTVIGSTLSGNSADWTGGGLYNAISGQAIVLKTQFINNWADFGGAIYSDSELVVTNSSITDNTANEWGGGIYNDGAGEITHTLINGNAAQYGGGIINWGPLSITSSTLAENTSTIDGAGIYNDESGSLVLTNSTLSGNTANQWGGGIINAGEAFLLNSTVFGNRADADGDDWGLAGGIYSGTFDLTLHHTIVAGNVVGSGAGTADDIFGWTNAASSFNLVGDAATAGGLFDGDNNNLVGVPWASVLDPSLADNGGLTPTHALLPGGPAVDAGDSAFDPDTFDPPLWFDQRGSGYDRVAGIRVDIGALELQDGPEPPDEPVADVFEPNDTRLTATDLDTLEGVQSWTDLSIHDEDDADWFRFTALGMGTLGEFVRIEFSHVLGDLELELYDADGMFVRGSWGVNDNEQIGLGGLTAGDYYVRVFGFDGATHPEYSVIVNAPPLVPVVAAPSHLYGLPVSSSQIRLAWRDNASSADGFVIERRAGFGGWATIGTVGAGVTEYLDEGLVYYETYGYRVHALRGEQASPSSNIAVARPHWPPPDPTWSNGDKSVLYIRIDFSDMPGEPVSDAAVADTMAEVNDHFLSMSYGQFSISSYDLTPTLRMPQTVQWYVDNDKDAVQLQIDARQVALANNFDYNDYWSDVVAFDRIEDWWWGGTGYVHTPGIWLNGDFGHGVTIHEFGHNLGALHSNFWQTLDGSVSGPGWNLEYGNPFDFMGGVGSYGDFIPLWKAQLGWLDPLEHVEIATASGTVELSAFDLGSVTPEGTYAVILPKEDGRTYWLEFRQDESHDYSEFFMDGILVNWEPWAESWWGTQLLDMRPESEIDPFWDRVDSALLVGMTYSDFDDNIHITPLAINPGESIQIVIYLGAQAPGTLHGQLWHDLDQDGTMGSGEPGLSDWRVFIDTNENGIYDDGETWTLTDIDGFYAFENMPPDQYELYVELPSNWQVSSFDQHHSVHLQFGWAAENLNFGLVPLTDHSFITQSFVYHKNSSFDPGVESGNIGDALDTTKSLAKEGSVPIALGFDNLINSSRGINGLVFDINGLPDPSLSASNFVFQWSPQGAFSELSNPPEDWLLAPSPTGISIIAGSPDRVVLTWPDHAIANRWLRITVLANANTGLAQPEVYYIGHLLGETTGLSGNVYSVTFADVGLIRGGIGLPADAGSIFDINKDNGVTFSDIAAMRVNVGVQLTNITIPANGTSGGESLPGSSDSKWMHDSRFGGVIIDEERSNRDSTLLQASLPEELRSSESKWFIDLIAKSVPNEGHHEWIESNRFRTADDSRTRQLESIDEFFAELALV